MTLTLLLDEHITPTVAERIRAKRPKIDVQSIFQWRNGAFKGVPDPAILSALQTEARVLVTYDIQMLSEWSFIFTGETPFAGIIFVDERTRPPNDPGGLVLALIALWDQNYMEDWTNRIDFLRSTR
ncbi:MAG: hypothetical protein JWL77_6166 [Chthonomonadaceae bacterium]|nr:hypothetical protein [Chthonomonadaceae bacterium]